MWRLVVCDALDLILERPKSVSLALTPCSSSCSRCRGDKPVRTDARTRSSLQVETKRKITGQNTFLRCITCVLQINTKKNNEFQWLCSAQRVPSHCCFRDPSRHIVRHLRTACKDHSLRSPCVAVYGGSCHRKRHSTPLDQNKAEGGSVPSFLSTPNSVCCGVFSTNTSGFST